MADLFISNLSYRTTEAELHDFLGSRGYPALKAVIGKDRNTGESRGFAFVEMARPEFRAQAILELDGMELAGRRINVRQAVDRPAHQSQRDRARSAR